MKSIKGKNPMVKGDPNKKQKKKQCATQFVKKDMAEKKVGTVK